jgi:xanthine dehydrogenase accessory factor
MVDASFADDVLGRAIGWLAQGRGVALATVVSTWGSAPRRVGSQLAVSDTGEFHGSVSGGCIEGAVIEAAREVIASGGVRRLRFGVTNEMAWEVGLACGGEIEIFVERAQRDLLERLQRARHAKRPAALVTDLASGEQWLHITGKPAPAGVHPDWQPAIAAALRADRAGPIEADGRPLFVNVWNPPLRLFVIGAVHIAQPLVRMARLAGIEVIVIDPRHAFAADTRFPDVEIAREWPAEALAALAPDSRSAIVALTHDPKLDDPGLAFALRSDAFYVGALGSRKTHAKRVARLREQGFSLDAIARIRGPIGLAIGAQTPAEIAISIIAEIVQALRQPVRA